MELAQVDVEDRDVGAHAERDPCRVLTGRAGAEDDDLGLLDAADAAEEDASSACRLHEMSRTDLRGQAAGDL